MRPYARNRRDRGDGAQWSVYPDVVTTRRQSAPAAMRAARTDRLALLMVLISSGFMIVQVSATDYGDGMIDRQVAGFWLLVGAVLLWLVQQRRSRIARGAIVVVSLGGAVVYGLGALDSGRAALIAVAYLGQALPLLTVWVQRHVSRR